MCSLNGIGAGQRRSIKQIWNPGCGTGIAEACSYGSEVQRENIRSGRAARIYHGVED